MKQIKFFDWNVDLQEGLFPVCQQRFEIPSFQRF
jgi:hypothetical protein